MDVRVLRPLAAETAVWTTYDVELVADQVLEPAPGDVQLALAVANENGLEQVYRFEPLPAEQRLARLSVKLNAAAGGPCWLDVRARIAGQWTPHVAVALPNDLGHWQTLTLAVDRLIAADGELAIGLTRRGAAVIAGVDVLYAVAEVCPMPFEPAGDLALVDGLVRVTLRRTAGDELPIEGALQRSITRHEAAVSGGRYTQADVAWHLDRRALDEPPEIGAALIDPSGREWTVLVVQEQTLASRWRCICRQLEVPAALTAQITIEHAVWTQDAAGAPRVTWQVAAAGVPAHVQPITARETIAHRQRDQQATHRVYLGQAVAVRAGDRLRQPDALYRVVQVSQTHRIDALAVLDVIALPPPLT